MQTKETHWRTAEVLVPHANHWQIIWRSTENLWRNDWKTTWGASTTHTSQKSWGTTEKTAEVLHSTTFTPKRTSEEMLRTHRGAITSCNTDNHQRTAEEPLKNRWGAGTPHTPENRWETSEEPQKYYTALQPPATDWVTDGNTFWRWVLASWMFCRITVNLSKGLYYSTRYKHRQAKSLLLWQSESKIVCAHKHKLYIINELVELL